VLPRYEIVKPVPGRPHCEHLKTFFPRRPELARKRAAEPADYQGKQRVTDSHEILGRARPTRNEERSAQLDCGDVPEPQDLTFKTCLENDVSILLTPSVVGRDIDVRNGPVGSGPEGRG
jgi:hypothetical protein